MNSELEFESGGGPFEKIKGGEELFNLIQQFHWDSLRDSEFCVNIP